jgi:hypothetical protein
LDDLGLYLEDDSKYEAGKHSGEQYYTFHGVVCIYRFHDLFRFALMTQRCDDKQPIQNFQASLTRPLELLNERLRIGYSLPL